MRIVKCAKKIGVIYNIQLNIQDCGLSYRAKYVEICVSVAFC